MLTLISVSYIRHEISGLNQDGFAILADKEETNIIGIY